MAEAPDPKDELPHPSFDMEDRLAALEAYVASADSRVVEPGRSGVIVHLAPWFWTALGVVLGVISTVVWVLTFDPHGGVELSAYLVPVTRWLLPRFYLHQSVPWQVWYSALFLHWPIFGALVDLLRRVSK